MDLARESISRAFQRLGSGNAAPGSNGRISAEFPQELWGEVYAADLHAAVSSIRGIGAGPVNTARRMASKPSLTVASAARKGGGASRRSRKFLAGQSRARASVPLLAVRRFRLFLVSCEGQ